MKEVRDMAAGMREAIASIRKSSADAKNNLAVEIGRAQTNAAKVRSFTQELRDANLEVESFLGETNSNFQHSEDSDTQQSPSKPDVNGVTLNKEP
jgi:hypothetical protein